MSLPPRSGVPSAAVLAGLVLTVAVSGCGSRAPSPAPTAPTVPSAAPQKPAASAASAPRKVKLAYAAQSPTLIVQVLGRDAGIFRKHNVEAETSYVGGGALLPALIGGDIQFAELSDPMVVTGVLQGAPIEWIAVNVHTPTLQLVVQPEIGSVEALKGKTIGVTNLGAVTALFAQLALSQHGLDPKKDVNLLATGGIPATLAAMSNKRIDGAMFSSLDGKQAVNQGGKVLVDFAKEGYTFPFGGLAVRKDFAAANPDVVTDVVKAFVEATALFKKDRAAAEKTMSAALSVSEQSVLDEGYDSAAGILDTNIVPTTKELRQSSTCSRRTTTRPKRPGLRCSSTTASRGPRQVDEVQSSVDAKLAERLVACLKEEGVNFITYVPETRLSQILPLMRADAWFQLVPVASEAEAVTIACGATLGGKRAACYMESSGVYVSSFSLLTMGRQLGVPILLIVAFLGGFADRRNSFLYAAVGRQTIPHLQGLGIEYRLLTDGGDLESAIPDAVRTMNALREPVALLFAGEFTT